MRRLIRLSAVTLILLGGCFRDYGAGGTGELVIPRSELREVRTVNVEQFATTRPTTIPATMPSTQPAPPELTVSIEDVRKNALENNLDLKVEFVSPSIAAQTLKQAQAQFEPSFTDNFQYSNLDQPTGSSLDSNQANSYRNEPAINIPLLTGGSITLSAPMTRQESDNQFNTLNPAYTSDFSASISIPLMRGFGVDANAQGIRIAFYDSQQAEAQTKLTVIRVLAEAERVYWRMYSAGRALEVRRKEYELAKAQLERARRQVRLGLAAEVEVTRAESGVADTVEQIINAENLLADRQRDLKRILNIPEVGMTSPTVLIPGTAPQAVAYKVNTERALSYAMNERMELLQTELQIAKDTANILAARNGLLPLVSLQYRYTANGLGGDFNDAVSTLFDKNFEDNFVGLQVEIPIGNASARAQYHRSLLNRIQSLATQDQQRAQVTQEVLAAIAQLETNWQRIIAAQQRVILSARTLDAEIRQFDRGLRTSNDVIDAQNRLANAQLSEILALADYQIAQVDLTFATGTLLSQSRVSWEPTRLP